MSVEDVTIAGAIEYGRRLRREAERNPDPYYQPYAPASDEAVRKLVMRHGSPAAALAWMKKRAAMDRREHDEEQTDAKRAQDRHDRHQRQAMRDRAASRAELTPGERIDAAIAALSVVGAVPAAQTDGDRITGSSESKLPRFPGDPSAFARHVAQDAVQKIETELDTAKMRLPQVFAPDNRDERLRKYNDLNPDQVARADRDQGTPRMVRDSRRRLGLDPETGRPVDRGEVAA